MIDTVKSLLFWGNGTSTVHECRHCGTTVDTPNATCPSCGNEEIASFRTG